MNKFMKLNDDNVMPWGIHKGTKMANVPASYLLYMYDNNKCDLPVKKYIEENIEVLKKENNK